MGWPKLSHIKQEIFDVCLQDNHHHHDYDPRSIYSWWHLVLIKHPDPNFKILSTKHITNSLEKADIIQYCILWKLLVKLRSFIIITVLTQGLGPPELYIYSTLVPVSFFSYSFTSNHIFLGGDTSGIIMTRIGTDTDTNGFGKVQYKRNCNNYLYKRNRKGYN